MEKIIEDYRNEIQEHLEEFASCLKKSTEIFINTLEEPKKEVKQAVSPNSEDEFDFIKDLFGATWGYIKGYYFNCDKISGYTDRVFYESRGFQILQFQEYLKQQNLQDKYNKFRLAKAEREYPAGTRINGMSRGSIRTIRNGNAAYNEHGDICIGGWMVNWNGKWAEKLTPLFKIEDGVDICEGDKCIPVELSNLEIHSETIIKEYNEKNFKYFLTPKSAKDWVKEERERREEKVELIKGDVYEMESTGGLFWIYRYTGGIYKTSSNSSLAKKSGCWYGYNDSDRYICNDETIKYIKTASKKQIKKLVKAEIKNGFYWDIEKYK